MPYIKQEERPVFQDFAWKCPALVNKGQLEYLITLLMINFMNSREHTYSNLHDCIYAVIHAAEEFKRTQLDPHEHEAELRNGSIWL